VSFRVLIFAEEEACGRLLAGVSLLDRLVLAAREAGAGEVTVVCPGERPKLARAMALGMDPDWTDAPPKDCGEVLLVAANLFVTADDLRAVEQKGGRLFGADGPLPCGMAPEWRGGFEDSLPKLPRVNADGPTKVVKDSLTAAQAEDGLWDTLGRESDSVVDHYFNRPLGRPLSKLLIHTPITPNAVSVAATVIGVVAAGCLAQGHPWWFLLGAVLLQLSAVIDCVDGDLARALYRTTPSGKWLDFAGGQLVHLCLFAGLGVGLHHYHGGGAAPWLGLVAVVGGVLGLVFILREKMHGAPGAATERLIQRFVNRDYSLLLIFLAVINRVEWFLWLAVVGTHVLWLALWQARRRSAAPAEEAA